MALVVKKWHSDVRPRDDGAYVDIVARQAGLISWLLALLKVDPQYTLRITFDKVIYEARSVFGYQRVVLPIASVSSLHFGYAKPWKWVLFWLVIFSASARLAWTLDYPVSAGLLVLAGLVVAMLVLIFKRSLAIGIRDQDGHDYSLQLKRSVIEGQEINEKALERITEIVVAIVDRHHEKPVTP